MPIVDVHGARRLDSLAVDVHETAGDGGGRLRSALEEARAPQPLVDAQPASVPVPLCPSASRLRLYHCRARFIATFQGVGVAASDCVDLLIVGGGINGAGIARDAAGRGLKVALVEQSDLAAGTSSASTKLIHGGLRYLEFFEFRLVRESLIERERLLRIAPHLVRPMQFILPHVPGLRPRWQIRFGLFFYDYFSGRRTLPALAQRARRRRRLRRAAARHRSRLRVFRLLGRRQPPGRAECAGRRAARRVDPHAHAFRLGSSATNGMWRARCVRQRSGEPLEIRARAIVNAAGPVGRAGAEVASRRAGRRAACGSSKAVTSSCRGCSPASTRSCCRTRTAASCSRFPTSRSARWSARPTCRSTATRRTCASPTTRSAICATRSTRYFQRVDRAERRALDVRRRAAARRTTSRRAPRASRATIESSSPQRDRASPAAVDLRRQDHDLSAPRRNRARETAGPARRSARAAGRTARRCPAATCPRGDFRRFVIDVRRRWRFLPDHRRATTRARLRHARRADHRRRAVDSRSRRALRRRPHRGGSRLPRRATSGR